MNSAQIAGYNLKRFESTQTDGGSEAQALMDQVGFMEMPVEIVNVRPGSKVILPRSKADKTSVLYAGGMPFFSPENDQFGAIEAVIPAGAVIQVVYSNTESLKDERVKVFTTI